MPRAEAADVHAGPAIVTDGTEQRGGRFLVRIDEPHGNGRTIVLRNILPERIQDQERKIRAETGRAFIEEGKRLRRRRTRQRLGRERLRTDQGGASQRNWFRIGGGVQRRLRAVQRVAHDPARTGQLQLHGLGEGAAAF